MTDADHDGFHLPSRALEVVFVVLLSVIATALVVVAFTTQRLIVEQQRTACYARLSWLAPGDEERPFGADRASAARNCEGSSPLIEFQDAS